MRRSVWPTYCVLLACMSFCQSSSNFSTICSLIWLRDWWVVYEPVTASSSSWSSSWSLWIVVSCWWVEGVIRRVIRHHPVAGWPTAPRYGHQIVSDIWRSTWRRFFFYRESIIPFSTNPSAPLYHKSWYSQHCFRRLRQMFFGFLMFIAIFSTRTKAKLPASKHKYV